MHSNYTYSKWRRDYGKQCRFSKWGPKVLEDMKPDAELEKNWLPKNPINRETDCGIEWSEHDVNTVSAEYTEHGIRHAEGGWPKDLNLDDPEQVVRFRKNAEKEEPYLQAILQMSVAAEHFLKQNNAIDVYEPYFMGPNCGMLQKPLAPSYKTLATISDPREPTRPVQHICWSPDQGRLMAVSYADMGFQMATPDRSSDSFIFDLEISTPFFTVESPHPVVTLEFNPRDAHCLAGGLMSGQVAFWDMRKGSATAAISSTRYSHRCPARSLHWIHSKISTEFYSGSSDGQVMWWDARKLAEPLEVLVLDLPKQENVPEWTKWARCHGVYCMDYDPTIPIQFMIGTETGLVFSGNRKGKTTSEKLSGTFYCHHGPVYSAQRNPAFLKNFLTIGDWQIKIWSDEIKESPIMWTKHHDVRLTDGAWSESKPSVFYTTRSDGQVDCWDVLQNQKDPILTIKIADETLKCIRCHEGGALLAVGDQNGKTHVIKLNDCFVTPGKNDKALLTEMFERETRREKIVETKLREMKLKNQTSDKPADAAVVAVVQAQIAEAEARMNQEMEKELLEFLETVNGQLSNDDNNTNTNELDHQEEIEEEDPGVTKDQTVD